MELLNGPQTLEKEPMLTPLICGGVWAPDEAQVDNRALGRALTAAFVRDGGNLQRN
jgi:glycine/D-amino acid oxidase-like deaminating enzyme